MKSIIENLAHHADDYECMWNGIEDMYIDRTGEKIPNQFFFAMSGFCSFAYIKTTRADLKRMVAFGEGRTRQMFALLGPIAGFDHCFIQSKSAEIALAKAKAEIDAGHPVVIGALDMYHLAYYPKLYHQYHVPFHYILMIGYDDAREVICLYDCGRAERLELSYADLRCAMGAEYAGLSKPNTICTIRMEHPKDKRHIVREALTYKANLFLRPPRGFLGFRGMRKLADEMPGWERELGREETVKILRNIVMFCGSVPQIPNRLLGIGGPDEITYMCSRDKMSAVLRELAEEYTSEPLRRAGELFWESGKVFERLCDISIGYILGGADQLDGAGEIVRGIARLESEAFELVLEGI